MHTPIFTFLSVKMWALQEKNKTILIARFLLNSDWTKLEENSFTSYSFTVWNFLKIFAQLYSHFSCAWLNANSRVYLQNQGQGTGFNGKISPTKFKKYQI
jgi:hypothetical protein